MYILFTLTIILILAALGGIISRDNKHKAEKIVEEIKRFHEQEHL